MEVEGDKVGAVVIDWVGVAFGLTVGLCKGVKLGEGAGKVMFEISNCLVKGNLSVRLGAIFTI